MTRQQQDNKYTRSRVHDSSSKNWFNKDSKENTALKDFSQSTGGKDDALTQPTRALINAL